MYAHCGYALLWSIQHLPLLSLTPLPPPPIFQQLLVRILIPSTFLDVMFYNITDALSVSFSFPKFQRVVLLQTCSTSEFVRDHACFCVYVCLLDLYSMYERKRDLCLSEPRLLHFQAKLLRTVALSLHTRLCPGWD
jgi:hypothetical protein